MPSHRLGLWLSNLFTCGMLGARSTVLVKVNFKVGYAGVLSQKILGYAGVLSLV